MFITDEEVAKKLKIIDGYLPRRTHEEARLFDKSNTAIRDVSTYINILAAMTERAIGALSDNADKANKQHEIENAYKAICTMLLAQENAKDPAQFMIEGLGRQNSNLKPAIDACSSAPPAEQFVQAFDNKAFRGAAIPTQRLFTGIQQAEYQFQVDPKNGKSKLSLTNYRDPEWARKEKLQEFVRLLTISNPPNDPTNPPVVSLPSFKKEKYNPFPKEGPRESYAEKSRNNGYNSDRVLDPYRELYHNLCIEIIAAGMKPDPGVMAEIKKYSPDAYEKINKDGQTLFEQRKHQTIKPLPGGSNVQFQPLPTASAPPQTPPGSTNLTPVQTPRSGGPGIK